MRGAHRPVCHAAEVHRPLRGSAAALSSTVMRRGLLHSFRPSCVSVAAFLLATATASAWAQFKVVGPDGRVTYTDRAPSPARLVGLAGLEPATLSLGNSCSIRTELQAPNRTGRG